MSTQAYSSLGWKRPYPAPSDRRFSGCGSYWDAANQAGYYESISGKEHSRQEDALGANSGTTKYKHREAEIKARDYPALPYRVRQVQKAKGVMQE